MIEKTQNPIKQIKEIQQLRQFLSEKKQEDLAQILEFGEKYKADSTNAEYNFWSTYGQEEYRHLLSQYEWSKQKFLTGLSPQERKILDSMPVIVKDKFFREYLFDWIVYSGDDKYGQYKKKINLREGDIGDERAKIIAKEWKDKFQPGTTIDLRDNNIGPEGAIAIAENWKNSLQPGMTINLEGNNIGPEGAKAIAKNWKNSLQPGMSIKLSSNELGLEGIKVIARERKDSFKPGIQITLGRNNIGPEGAIAIAENWKNNLQPGMRISLYGNKIGLDGVKAISENWKDKLQPGMQIGLVGNNIGNDGADMIKNMVLKDCVTINLRNNDISDDKIKELKQWEKSYHNQGIICDVFLV